VYRRKNTSIILCLGGIVKMTHSATQQLAIKACVRESLREKSALNTKNVTLG
jgi:hypothetical protein